MFQYILLLMSVSAFVSIFYAYLKKNRIITFLVFFLVVSTFYLLKVTLTFTFDLINLKFMLYNRIQKHHISKLISLLNAKLKVEPKHHIKVPKLNHITILDTKIH